MALREKLPQVSEKAGGGKPEDEAVFSGLVWGCAGTFSGPLFPFRVLKRQN